MDRAQKAKEYISTQFKNKNQAGYYKQNVNNNAYQYLREVLKERNTDTKVMQDEIMHNINQIIGDDEE